MQEDDCERKHTAWNDVRRPIEIFESNSYARYFLREGFDLPVVGQRLRDTGVDVVDVVVCSLKGVQDYLKLIQ